jgi:hypothetical protein
LGKSLFLFVFIASIAGAQDAAPAPSPSLQQAAEKQTAEWQTLAKGLELRIARMLPCDPRVKDAIEEVSRASEARLAALARYLQDAAAGAKRQSDAAEAALAAEQTGAREMEIETAEAEQDGIAIDGQLADLTDSVKAKPDVEGARAKLEAIAGMVRQRLPDTKAQAARNAALTAALGDAAAAFQVRQKAIETEVTALAVETSRWSDYYATRLARSQTECSITQTTGRSEQRKKQ